MQKTVNQHSTFIVLTTACLTLFICDFLYSSLGFNPTDEGFILSYARRILEGEVPHRDFIWIRPAGSALLHLPVALLGGDYTYRISRATFLFQMVAISAIWVWLFSAASGVRSRLLLSLMVVISFIFSIHTFPLMAWYTTDGIFLSSIAILILYVSQRKGWRWFSYFLLGFAPLCKQNFGLMPLVVPFFFGDWKKRSTWIWAGAAPVAYLLWIAFGRGLTEMYEQMTALTSLKLTGYDHYVYKWETKLGVILGAVAAFFITRKRAWCHFLALGFGVIALFWLAKMFRSTELYALRTIYAIFGYCCGLMLAAVLRRGESMFEWQYGKLLLLCLILAWSASISLGCPTPVLAIGPLVVGGLLLKWELFLNKGGWQRVIPFVGTLAVGFMSYQLISLFHHNRTLYPYRDLPKHYLTYKLDGVMRGLKGIRTSQRTYDFLNDLNEAKKRTNSKRIAILPEIGAYWTQSAQPNPLPIDLVFQNELPNEQLNNVVIYSIGRQRNDLSIIVQKFEAGYLKVGWRKLGEAIRSDPTKWVKDNFKKVDETKYFEIWESPTTQG